MPAASHGLHYSLGPIAANVMDSLDFSAHTIPHYLQIKRSVGESGVAQC
jgi:hypothetical protein